MQYIRAFPALFPKPQDPVRGHFNHKNWSEGSGNLSMTQNCLRIKYIDIKEILLMDLLSLPLS